MDINNIVLDFFNNIGSFPFDTVFKVVALFFIIFWVMICSWVFLDAKERSQNRGFAVLSFVFVLIFNLPGLLIYMIIRPKMTLQEQYWTDLEKRYLLYETAELFDCPKCGYPLRPGFVNCPNCSETIKVKCECGVNIDKYWKHCPFCGRVNNKSVAYQQAASVNTMPAQEQKAETKGGLNSVFKQTQVKLATLKEKLGQKKEKVQENTVVEKKNKKGKKKK